MAADLPPWGSEHWCRSLSATSSPWPTPHTWRVGLDQRGDLSHLRQLEGLHLAGLPLGLEIRHGIDGARHVAVGHAQDRAEGRLLKLGVWWVGREAASNHLFHTGEIPLEFSHAYGFPCVSNHNAPRQPERFPPSCRHHVPITTNDKGIDRHARHPPEDGSDVVSGPDIVKHQNQGVEHQPPCLQLLQRRVMITQVLRPLGTVGAYQKPDLSCKGRR
jgi:hypothetical protein